MESWWSTDGEDLRITVRVTPNARRDEVTGLVDDALRLRIAAPPIDGRANERLRRFVAEIAGVRRTAVSVVRGATGRNKWVRIVGHTEPPTRLRRAAERAG